MKVPEYRIRAPVMRPDMLRYVTLAMHESDRCVGAMREGDICAGTERERERRIGNGEGSGRERYISGSFCVSITAAMGMPKFETGPQKSAENGQLG